MDKLNDYLRRPEWLGFKSKHGKVKFTEEMRQAFGDCISNLVAVPVEGHPADGMERYVLETDITPDHYICKDFTFEYCDFEGNTQCYIRVGSSNIKRELYVDNKGNNTFDSAVKGHIDRRARADLTIKKEDLEQRVQSLQSEVPTLYTVKQLN